MQGFWWNRNAQNSVTKCSGWLSKDIILKLDQDLKFHFERWWHSQLSADWKITPAFQVSNSKLQSSAKSQISLFRERVTSSSSQTAKLPPWTNVVLDGCSTVIIYKIYKCIKNLCMDKCICSTNQRFSKDGILFCVLKKCVSSSYQRLVDDGIYK